MQTGSDVADIIVQSAKAVRASGLQEEDIVVISSKAVATAEGRIIDLRKLTVSVEAKKYAAATQLSPEFCQAVLEETAYRSGKLVGSCPGALLTELVPRGLPKGSILTANAGLDQSNITEGFAVGWPLNPVKSVARLRRELETRVNEFTVSRFSFFVSKKQKAPQRKTNNEQRTTNLAVILSDSCCAPRRLGVTAFALAVSGLDPFQSQVGKLDLFGKPLRITTEAVADQLSTGANFLMGNAGQGVPAVVIRDHGLPLSDFEGWVEGISQEEDLFRCEGGESVKV